MKEIIKVLFLIFLLFQNIFGDNGNDPGQNNDGDAGKNGDKNQSPDDRCSMNLDWVAANPQTYSHDHGGGVYGDRRLGTNVETTLQGYFSFPSILVI